VEYSYEIDSENTATVTYVSATVKGTLSQRNFPNTLTPWTAQDAKEWAENLIQSMKDSDTVRSSSVYFIQVHGGQDKVPH
jgi:hypothetical protein